MKQKNIYLYRMILTALFIALTYAGTFVAIPVGISKVHLGNFVAIIASLLCGGLIGGISGGVGMALNDLTMGYGLDTIFRTLIVKFLMGLITGIIFKHLVNKKSKVKYFYIVLICIFTLVFITFLILYIVYGTSFAIGDKTFKNSLFLVISLGVISLFFLILFLVSNKIKVINQYVLLATSIGSTLNIILEFIIKIPFKMWFANMSFEAAFVYALTSLPSAIITAILTIVFVSAIYLPVYLATKRFNKLDTLSKNILSLTHNDKENSN